LSNASEHIPKYKGYADSGYLERCDGVFKII